MLRRYLLPLPMHPRSLAVINLHPIHADIALARARVPRMNAWQRYETPSIVRPALEDRKHVEIEVGFQDDLLARRVFRADGLRKGARQRTQLRKHLQFVPDALSGSQREGPDRRERSSLLWLAPTDAIPRQSC